MRFPCQCLFTIAAIRTVLEKFRCRHRCDSWNRRRTTLGRRRRHGRKSREIPRRSEEVVSAATGAGESRGDPGTSLIRGEASPRPGLHSPAPADPPTPRRPGARCPARLRTATRPAGRTLPPNLRAPPQSRCGHCAAIRQAWSQTVFRKHGPCDEPSRLEPLHFLHPACRPASRQSHTATPSTPRVRMHFGVCGVTWRLAAVTVISWVIKSRRWTT